jgi:hypothetical protein
MGTVWMAAYLQRRADSEWMQMSGDGDQTTRNGSLVETLKVYLICLFERGAIVPEVRLVEAACDEDAISLAQAMHPSAEREVWDMDRRVAHFPGALDARSIWAWDDNCGQAKLTAQVIASTPFPLLR